jgi:acyl carrier protein
MSQIEILHPDELKANYQGPDGTGEYPAYTRADWQKVVALGLTIDGYWTWVHNSLCDEVAEADAEEDMDVSQVSYADKGTCTLIDPIPPAKFDPVSDSVFKVVAEQLGWSKSELTLDKSLVGDLGADSLDQIELVMAIEEEFEIDIPDDDAEKIETVGQIVDYVKLRKS